MAEVLYGSTLHLLVHHVLKEEPQRNLAFIWKEIAQAYALFDIESSLRFSKLKLTSFSIKGGCKLKGRTASIRALGITPPYVCALSFRNVLKE